MRFQSTLNVKSCYVIQVQEPAKPSKDKKFPVLNKMSQDKNWPQDAILLPGNCLNCFVCFFCVLLTRFILQCLQCCV